MQGHTFDWPGAIVRNRDALLRIVAALFAMAGLPEDGAPATLPRHLRNRLLRLLRPAESAVRRLIVMAARDMSVDASPARSVILGFNPRTHSVKVKTAAKVTNPTLPLLDSLPAFPLRPRRRYAKSFPRITCIGLSEPTPIPDGWYPAPDDELDARPVCRRLEALKRALDDLDGHARRLARWRARRDAGRTGRFHPLRPGRPPGHRKRPIHEIDDVLRECHSLAHLAMKPPDTS